MKERDSESSNICLGNLEKCLCMQAVYIPREDQRRHQFPKYG